MLIGLTRMKPLSSCSSRWERTGRIHSRRWVRIRKSSGAYGSSNLGDIHEAVEMFRFISGDGPVRRAIPAVKDGGEKPESDYHAHRPRVIDAGSWRRQG